MNKLLLVKVDARSFYYAVKSAVKFSDSCVAIEFGNSITTVYAKDSQDNRLIISLNSANKVYKQNIIMIDKTFLNEVEKVIKLNSHVYYNTLLMYDISSDNETVLYLTSSADSDRSSSVNAVFYTEAEDSVKETISKCIKYDTSNYKFVFSNGAITLLSNNEELYNKTLNNLSLIYDF